MMVIDAKEQHQMTMRPRSRLAEITEDIVGARYEPFYILPETVREIIEGRGGIEASVRIDKAVGRFAPGWGHTLQHVAEPESGHAVIHRSCCHSIVYGLDSLAHRTGLRTRMGESPSSGLVRPQERTISRDALRKRLQQINTT